MSKTILLTFLLVLPNYILANSATIYGKQFSLTNDEKIECSKSKTPYAICEQRILARKRSQYVEEESRKQPETNVIRTSDGSSVIRKTSGYTKAKPLTDEEKEEHCGDKTGINRYKCERTAFILKQRGQLERKANKTETVVSEEEIKFLQDLEKLKNSDKFEKRVHDRHCLLLEKFYTDENCATYNAELDMCKEIPNVNITSCGPFAAYKVETAKSIQDACPSDIKQLSCPFFVNTLKECLVKTDNVVKSKDGKGNTDLCMKKANEFSRAFESLEKMYPELSNQTVAQEKFGKCFSENPGYSSKQCLTRVKLVMRTEQGISALDNLNKSQLLNDCVPPTDASDKDVTCGERVFIEYTNTINPENRYPVKSSIGEKGSSSSIADQGPNSTQGR